MSAECNSGGQIGAAEYALGLQIGKTASAEFNVGGQIGAAEDELDNHSGSGFNKRSD